MIADKHTGYVKKESLYTMVAIALMVGFLSGVVFTIYKSPASSESVPVAESQQQDGGHDLSALEKQVAATPNDFGAWVHLGNAYFDTDQAGKAVTAYNKALAITPGNPDVLTDLGVMYRRNKQPEKALDAFNRAIKAAPEHQQSRLNKGVVLFYDKDDKEGAFQVWQELLDINPGMKIPTGQLLKEFLADLQKQ